MEDADEERERVTTKGGKGNDMSPMNPRGGLSPMNPKAYIDLPIPT